jgi:eukaryotic-like serine/threonine-protein kinase
MGRDETSDPPLRDRPDAPLGPLSPSDGESTLLRPVIGLDGRIVPWEWPESDNASDGPSGGGPGTGYAPEPEKARGVPSSVQAEAPAAPPAAADDTSTRLGPLVAPENLETCLSRPEPSALPALPGYLVETQLGSGGMGVVYAAVHHKLKRRVALKMIHRDLNADPDQLDRFRHEAEALARLRHPNVVQIHDVGEVGGVPYLSLELLEGGTLADRLAGAAMPPDQAARLAVTLARAVGAVHRVGIIHRDLKPSNILFDDETPKVTDFGLAKRLEVDRGETQTGAVMGTPNYMAPEQAQGLTALISRPADIYALGAVLYEMLTGRPPFKGAGMMETLRQVVSEEPTPPSRLQPRLPRDLETICLKCLEKPPERRYLSADELADDLMRFLDGEPIQARRTPVWERVAKRARRRPAMATLVGLVTALLIGAIIAAERYSASARDQARRRERRIAELRIKALDDLDGARRQSSSGLLDQARLTLSTLLTEIRAEPADVRNDAQLVAYARRADADLRDTEGRLGQAAAKAEDLKQFRRFGELRDEVLLLDGNVAASLSAGLDGEGGERPDAAEPAARKGADERRLEPRPRIRKKARELLGDFKAGGDGEKIARAPPWAGSLDAAQRAGVEADTYLLLIVLSEAVSGASPGEDPHAQANEGLRILDRAARLRGPTPAFHLRRAACYERLGDAAAAERERARAAELKPARAFDHLLLGRERLGRGQWDAARLHFEEASKLEPGLFWARFWLAISELNTQPPRAAEAKAELSACVSQQPGYAWLYLFRGFAYGQMGLALASAQASGRRTELAGEAERRFADAEAEFREAIDRGLEPAFRYILQMNRGVIRFRRGRWQEAATDFEQAIALDRDRYNGYASLAQALRKLGRYDEAVVQMGVAIARERRMAALYTGRALARLDRQNLAPAEAEAALGDLRQALELEPAGSRAAANARNRIGQLLLRVRRAPEALAEAESALAIAPDSTFAHLLRVSALLELGRYDEMISSCDVALARGAGGAEVYRLRGLARDRRGEHAAAADDYSYALALHPDIPAELHRHRGWSHLQSGSPAFARRDFEAVLRLQPKDADALAGRAAARVRLGEYREGVADAEASLVLGEPSPRLLLNAADTLANAASRAAADMSRRGLAASRNAKAYRARAARLLQQSLDRTPEQDRPRYRREIVARDSLLSTMLLDLKIRERTRPVTGSPF